MKFSYRFFTTSILIAICVGVTTMSASANGMPEKHNLNFTWINPDSILVYSTHTDPTFIFELQSWQLTKLDYSTKNKLFNLSSDGTKIIVYDDLSTFQFGDPRGPLSKPIDIPLWLTIPNDIDQDKYFYTNVENRFFWANSNNIVANQRDRETGTIVCKSFDSTTNHWQDALEYCVDAQSGNINDILYNMDSQLLIINGSVESAQELTIEKWNGTSSTALTKFPSLNLTHGFVNAGFNTNQDSVWLMSPCSLVTDGGEVNQQPCKGVDLDSDRWNHYYWSAGQADQISLIRSKLPIGSIPSPFVHDLYVWARHGEICVGDPASEKKFRCKLLP